MLPHATTSYAVPVMPPQPTGLLVEVLTRARQIADAAFGLIQLLDARSGSLVIAVQHGFDEAFLGTFRLVSPQDPCACGRALRFGRRVYIADIYQDPYFTPYRSVADEAGFRAVQSTPIVDEDRGLVGILSTHFRSPRRLTRADARGLDACAAQAASVIHIAP